MHRRRAGRVPWPAPLGHPLAFVAQVNLADVARLHGTDSLPREGLLSFFYDVEVWPSGLDPVEGQGWHVRYSAPGLPLRRTPPPDALPSSGRYRPVALDVVAAATLPPVTSPALADVGLDAVGWRRYERLVRWREDRERPLHRLLGHESVVQTHDQPLACEQASSGDTSGSPEERDRGARAWRLLLQIDSDDAANMEWGDAGRLFFWIRSDDLRTLSFDKTWLLAQSH